MVRVGCVVSLALAAFGCAGRAIESDAPDASISSQPVVPTATSPAPSSPESLTEVNEGPLASLVPAEPPHPAAPVPERNELAETNEVEVEPIAPAPPEEPGPAAPEPPAFPDAYPAVRPSPGLRCHHALDALAVSYRAIPTDPGIPGIVDPVLLSSPLRGVHFRYVHAKREDPLLLDCRFVIQLSRAVDVLAARGVEEFQHVGSYVYRCFGKGTPPDCQLSQHAMGMALDFVGFTKGDRTYRVIRDFVVNKEEHTPTCEGPRRDEADAFIKDIVCAWWEARAFRVLLTPNYDEKHRDHIHVDLAEGSGPQRAFTLEGATDGVDPLGAKHAH